MRTAQSRDSAFRAAAEVFDRIPSLFWITDGQGVPVTVGGGLRPPVDPGSVSDLFTDEGSAKRAEAATRDALSGKRGLFVAVCGERELQAFVEPLAGANGTVGIAVDATERIVMERAVRASEHSFRTLVEESPAGVLRVTPGGQLLQANRAVAAMMEFDAGQDSEMLLLDLPRFFSRPDGYEKFRASLSMTSALHGHLSMWRTRTGREIHVSLGGTVVRDDQGAPMYLDVMAMDVSERRKLEIQLEHAQKLHLVGQLAGGVAHGFNNMMTIVNGHLQLLLRSASDAEAAERLRTVQEAAGRATALTRQLLAFSRMQVFETRKFDLNELLSETLALIAPLMPEDVNVQFNRSEEECPIRADPAQIEQVLMNLAVNARDAMPDGGELRIATARAHVEALNPGPDSLETGDYVQLTVRDTGRGMDAETKARIFEPFFTTKDAATGTGLGLSVSYGIVRQSGGYIDVRSEPGSGTEFVIYLPVDKS